MVKYQLFLFSYFFSREKVQERDNDNPVSQKGKSGNLRGSKPHVDQEKHSDNKNGGGDGKKNNATVEETNSEYFRKYTGTKMTVVFSAVLAPHFKFEEGQGDRIVMRFGGVAFGRFNENVVEVYPVR